MFRCAAKMVVAVLCIAGVGFGATITLGVSKFSRYSGDGFVKADGCDSRWVHKKGTGSDITRNDCPGTTLRGEEAATFPGPSGSYKVTLKLLAKNNKPGTAKWWLKINSTNIGGGTSPMASACEGKPVCESKTLCSNTCINKDLGTVQLKQGDKIIFGGTTSWPCGCTSARGGYYTGYGGVTLTGGPATAVQSQIMPMKQLAGKINSLSDGRLLDSRGRTCVPGKSRGVFLMSNGHNAGARTLVPLFVQ